MENVSFVGDYNFQIQGQSSGQGNRSAVKRFKSDLLNRGWPEEAQMAQFVGHNSGLIYV